MRLSFSIKNCFRSASTTSLPEPAFNVDWPVSNTMAPGNVSALPFCVTLLGPGAGFRRFKEVPPPGLGRALELGPEPRPLAVEAAAEPARAGAGGSLAVLGSAWWQPETEAAAMAVDKMKSAVLRIM